MRTFFRRYSKCRWPASGHDSGQQVYELALNRIELLGVILCLLLCPLRLDHYDVLSTLWAGLDSTDFLADRVSGDASLRT